jgi:hypothetical protein
MKSLKAALIPLSRVLRISAPTLYGRQQELVNEGLLESIPGKGPGSGVRATPDAIAMLLIAVAGNLNGHRPEAIANTEAKFGRCPLTGSRTFREALTVVLKSEAPRVFNVRFDARGNAYIDYDIPKQEPLGPPETSVFGSFNGESPEPPPLDVAVSIGNKTIQAIATIVAGLES